jgi:hypothetical protein
MHRYALLAATISVFSLAMLPSAPALAITAKQKMATCKFGADDQKLTGKERADFMRNCMSNKNDPRGTAVGTPAARGAPGAAPKD